MNSETTQTPAGMNLPFHLGTIATAIIGRWWQFLIVIAGSAVLAWDGGHRFGSSTYTASTALLYARAADTNSEIGDSTFLFTHRDMVKMPENLNDLRKDLALESSLQAIGAAIDVRVVDNTGLLVLHATWNDGPTVAAIANSIRDIFLRRHLQLMGAGELRALESQRREHLATADSIEMQLAELGELEKKIRVRMESERKVNPQTEGLGDVNIRIERLRDAIFDDQTYRANLADLARLEVEYGRAQRLVAEGLLSPQEADEAKAAYLAQKARTIDTEQVGEWRSELERLQSIAMPAESATSPSAPVLQEMLLNEFNLGLDLIRTRESLDQINQRMLEVNAALTDPDRALRDENAGLNFFRVLSTAETPILPESSTKKLIAIAIAVLSCGFGMLIILLRVLLDRRLLSKPDSKAKLGLRSLGGWRRGRLRHVAKGCDEDLLMLTNQMLAEGTHRLLLVGLRESKWLARTAAHIAASAQQLERSVLVIDASRDEMTGNHAAREIVSHTIPMTLQEAQRNPQRLADQLVENKIESSHVATLSNPQGNEQATPMGQSFRAMLSALENTFDLVIVLGPDPSTTQKVALLADECDQTMVIMRARRFKAGRVKRDLGPLLARKERLGVVLGEMSRRYASISDAA